MARKQTFGLLVSSRGFFPGQLSLARPHRTDACAICVFTFRGMLKLRPPSTAGRPIGCNYDPSHMFWQGIDPIAAIRVLGDYIFYVHAKDTQIYERNLR